MAAKYRIGQCVTSQSGLTYLVLQVHKLDEHGSFAYTVRRISGGWPRGPTRNIAECNLFPGR